MHGLTRIGVPPLPKWLLFLRVAIIVVCLGILVAAAYNISLFDDYYGITSSPASFLIFDVVFTWLILGFMLASELFFRRFYYRLAFVVLIAIDCIFWLSGWAWAARWAGWLGTLGRLSGGSGDGLYRKFYGSITAGAVLGAFVWVALIITVVFFTRACLADRDGADVATAGGGDAELGQRKPEGVQYVYSQQQYPPQQPAYGQYPAPGQQPQA